VQVRKSATSPFQRYAIQGLPVKARTWRVELARRIEGINGSIQL
jgi:hypothetical protein